MSGRQSYANSLGVSAGLPPTPVSPRAWQQMLTWGIPAEYIEILREKCAMMRYDLCVAKTGRMARNGAYMCTRDDEDWVIVPFYFDVSGRGDGQCGDLARSLITQLNFSGWLDDLNTYFKRMGEKGLDLTLTVGQSELFFDSPQSTHVWIMLSKHKTNLRDSILLDPSFQKICMYDESGYTMNDRKAFVNPKVWNHMMSGGLLVTNASIHNGELVIEPCRTHVLGISQAGDAAYGFGFANIHGHLCPILTAWPPHYHQVDMTPIMTTCQNKYYWNGNFPHVSHETRIEMGIILSNLADMPIVPTEMKNIELPVMQEMYLHLEGQKPKLWKKIQDYFRK